MSLGGGGEYQDARTASALNSCALPSGLQNLPKIHPKNNRVFFDRFYVQFRPHFGFHFRPFGCPNRSNFDPTSSSNLICFKNVDFHENLYKPMIVDDFSPQDGPQNDPRPGQDSPKKVSETFFFHCDFCLRF